MEGGAAGNRWGPTQGGGPGNVFLGIVKNGKIGTCKTNTRNVVMVGFWRDSIRAKERRSGGKGVTMWDGESR